MPDYRGDEQEFGCPRCGRAGDCDCAFEVWREKEALRQREVSELRRDAARDRERAAQVDGTYSEYLYVRARHRELLADNRENW